MKTPLMKTRLGKKLRNESGQALIITIMCLTVLLGFVGFAVDLGYMFYVKRELQTAADAAALAGASTLTTNAPALATVKAAVANDAALNGVTNGSNGLTVSVTWPYTPQSMCSGCTANNFVEVTVSQTQQTGFMSLFGTNPTTVAARAVAFAQNSPGCMFALNPAATPGFTLNGLLLAVNAPTCAIYIDSTGSTNALSTPGFLESLTAKSIGIVGNPGYSAGGFSSISPHPVGGMVPVADPLAYLTPPATGACLPSHTAYVAAAGATISPGNYCACPTGSSTCTPGAPAITVSAGGVTFSPGTYILNGEGYATGGLKINAGSFSGSVTGNGVTFYLYNGATFAISGGLSGFTPSLTLTAPGPAGQYPGILFYQDRADNGSATIGGAPGTTSIFSFLTLAGAIYLPAGSLTFPSGISVTTLQNNTILVANTMQWVGFLGLFQDYDKATGSGGISPIKTTVLTE